VVEEYPRNLAELEAKFGLRRHVGHIWLGFDGRRVSVVGAAVAAGRGHFEGRCWSALGVAVKLQ
jgi:hypothetical protein